MRGYFSLYILKYNFFFFFFKILSNIFNFNINKKYSYFFFYKYRFIEFYNNFFFFIIDKIYIIIFKKSNNVKFRVNYRLEQTSWRFYNNVFISNNLFGLKSIWDSMKYWLLSIILGGFIFYYLTYLRLLPFSKIMFEWILIIMFVYWFFSGFVFFIKKYQYSKYTSIIQRFWKRSYILFWLIESCIFVCFFYLTLNASEEPTYMYDQIKIYKLHLFSWRVFLLKLIPTIFLIIFGYLLLLNLKWNTFSKQNVLLILITLNLIYIVWLEFYQFFHIINFYNDLIWSYDSEELIWNLDVEFRRTRLFNNYLAICLLAKFWHLIFIFLFWVFFLLRINEIKRVRYPLLAANLQNFIILYIMSWLYMSPWLKFIFRKQLDNSYYWFFLNNRYVFWRVFFMDIKLYLIGLFDRFFSFIEIKNFTVFDFYYFYQNSNYLNYNNYTKEFIKDYIIYQLN